MYTTLYSLFNPNSPVPQISTNASAGLDDIVNSRTHDEQPFFFQLYMNRDRPKSSALIQKIASMRSLKTGARIFKAIVLTVDAPWPGKREADEKIKSQVVLVSRLYILSRLQFKYQYQFEGSRCNRRPGLRAGFQGRGSRTCNVRLHRYKHELGRHRMDSSTTSTHRVLISSIPLWHS